MSFSIVPYLAAIKEAEKTGEPVDFYNVTSEMIAEHLPECDPDLRWHFRDGALSKEV